MELIRIIYVLFNFKINYLLDRNGVKVHCSTMLIYSILVYSKKYHMTFLFFAYICWVPNGHRPRAGTGRPVLELGRPQMSTEYPKQAVC